MTTTELKQPQEPNSYRHVMLLEYKRYLASMEEAGEAIIQNSDPSSDDDTGHSEHLDKTRTAHIVTKLLASLIWEEYIIKGLGEAFMSHAVSDDNTLIAKSPMYRSQLETYAGALRSFFKSSSKSYIAKVLLPGYALEDLHARFSVLGIHISEILKYIELTSHMLEEYMTWIEHSSTLAAQYINAHAPSTYINDEGEEQEYIDVEPEDLYCDVRIRAYALLKLCQLNPARLASQIENIDNLICALNSIIDLGHRLYSSITPETFENIFNMLVSKKHKAPHYEGTKFANIHELNEYIRTHMRESVEEPQGFMYNVSELLEETRSHYIDKLATEVTEIMAFLPTKHAQQIFIKQFESGTIWLDQENGA